MSTAIHRFNEYLKNNEFVANFVLKPIVIGVIGVCISAYTLYMQATYVSKFDFSSYIKEQKEMYSRKDEMDKKTNDATAAQLQTIIIQQAGLGKQLEGYNLVLVSIQSQLDKHDNRLLWLERNEPQRDVSISH